MSAALTANLYYYQNPNTQQPSSSPVSVKQLCRIICPIQPTATSNTEKASSSSSSLIDGNTPVLAFDPETGSYDEKGWKAASTVPILREASALWHYEALDSTKNKNNLNGNEDQTDVSFTVKGPLNCRQLATMYYEESESESASASASASITNETRVWSPQLNEWKPIIQIPDLINAFEAIHGGPSAMPNNAYPFGEQDETTKSENDKHDETSKLDDFFTSMSAHTEDDDMKGTEENHTDGPITSQGNDQDSSGVSGQNKSLSSTDEMNAGAVDGDASHPSKKQKTQNSKPSIQINNSQPNAIMMTIAKKKKHKKPSFKAKNAKNWVYIAGLPTDTNEKEVADFFAKVGILDIDPELQTPKVKLYREKHPQSALKGDATVCYARPESVNLALQILDGAIFRTVDSNGKFIEPHNAHKITVQRAKFQQHGEEYKKKAKVSDVKRKVARIAKLQAIGWDEGDNGYITGGLKGLTIIVLKYAFDVMALKRAGKAGEDSFLAGVERRIKNTCESFGTVEKITIFSSRDDAVVIVKFTQPTGASLAVEAYHGKEEDGRIIEAKFWDGVTDYTQHNFIKEAEDTEKRLDEFGNWLDDQELPDEFKLKVEGS